MFAVADEGDEINYMCAETVHKAFPQAVSPKIFKKIEALKYRNFGATTPAL
jgi:hypothetical protein